MKIRTMYRMDMAEDESIDHFTDVFETYLETMEMFIGKSSAMKKKPSTI
jgi:hypothetical protein